MVFGILYIIISEGSCETEGWSIEDENSALPSLE